MIVTIDGPSGSGKSTTARLLARQLGFEFLDTGSMFRALALFCLRERLDPAVDPLNGHLERVGLRVEPGRVWLGDDEVTDTIRCPNVTAESSRIAVFPPVRTYLAQRQREVARGRNVVTEGRDQGTAVFPDAEVKFFLTADVMVRAERRFQEMRERGSSVALEDVIADLTTRDRRDSSREIAPLRPAPDAIHIDTTGLTIEEVLGRMEREVRRCSAG